MSASSMRILCRYQYDPLDRLTGVGLLERASTQRFYQEDYLITELGEQTRRTIIRHEARPLAQQQSAAGDTETTLLATDQAHSLLQTIGVTNPQQLAFTAYGHHPADSGLSRVLGFNGECPDAITGHYLLGKGTRAFNPVLMRFNSPDQLSPFGEGGINCYSYCQGDPINFNDPTGNIRFKVVPRKIIRNTFGKIQKPQHKIKKGSTTAISAHSQANNPTSKKMPETIDSNSELMLLPFELFPTKRPTNPAILSETELKLIDEGLKYDSLKTTPGFISVATREQVDLLDSNRMQAMFATNETAKQLISEKSRGVILHMKEESVKYHEAQAANKRVRQ
jgi:RHS repeat-associated protein